MNRRDFLIKLTAVPLAGIAAAGMRKLHGAGLAAEAFARGRSGGSQGEGYIFEGHEVFDKIVNKSAINGWGKLPLGELMGKIGMELVGIPYVGGTLETGGKEVCTVNMEGLDCVTFFENTLDMARVIKKGNPTHVEMIDEISYTRYRGGNLKDYTSRLHYTADWIFDNVRKGVVEDISKELGGEVFPYDVYFMSKNWKYYDALKNNPDMIEKIKRIEMGINARDYYYIPKKKIKSIEKKLQTGDIIAFATDKKGLDYAHTGLVYVDDKKKVRILHASSANKKVKLDKEIHKYISKIKSDIGISIARPLPVA